MLSSQAFAFVAFITSCSTAVIYQGQSVHQVFQSPSNVSLPHNLLNASDPRFGLRGRYGQETLNIISLLVNTVNGLANLAHQPFHRRVSAFHVEILPWYADLDISIQPLQPEVDIEVRVAIYALYYAVYYMIQDTKFTNVDYEILWDSKVVGRISITKGASSSATVNNFLNSSQNTTIQNAQLFNTFNMTNLKATPNLGNEGLRPFFEYYHNAEKLTSSEVFVTIMAALKALAHWPSTQVVEPFRTGASGFNTRIQFLGDEVPRTQPPFLTYGLLIDTVRQIPIFMLEKKRFAELMIAVAYDDEILGKATLEKGSPDVGIA